MMATVATVPFCTQGQVAFFVRQLFTVTVPGDLAFDDSTTTPTKTEVEFMIDMASSEVEVAYRNVGYKVPFAAYPGEDWPESNTNYLRFLTVLGASAAVVDAMLPAPAMGEGTDHGQGNAYDKRYRGMLRRLGDDAGQGFRAECYNGTRAKKRLSVPRAPMTDFGQGIIDGANYMGISAYTQLMCSELKVWADYGGGSVESYNYDTLRMWGRR